VEASTRFWEGLGDAAIEPTAVSLASPFPHARFDGTGLRGHGLCKPFPLRPL
jgi:hypothetical protein